MTLSFQEPRTNGVFSLRKDDQGLTGHGINGGGTINTIVLNRGNQQRVEIDQVRYDFPGDCILPLVANQHFVFERPEELFAWQFNREFYCIADHDAEVGCVGFLFYGIQHPLFIFPSPMELGNIETLEQWCLEEMAVEDTMKGEMLRTLLKRLIITVTRIAKRQTGREMDMGDEKLDLIRMFNLLVEAHFRNHHTVQFYAEALNKSPKTLTNHFAQYNYPAPSKLIYQRIVQEAKRYLFYTDMTAREIAYLLGFANPAHFSRFFKKQTGKNFSAFQNVAGRSGGQGGPKAISGNRDKY